MGYKLMRIVVEDLWPTMPQHADKARTVLVVMARYAIDTDVRPWFGKGDHYLAEALGYPEDPNGKKPGNRPRRGTEAVERARDLLIELGYVDPVHLPLRNAQHLRKWVLTLPGHQPADRSRPRISAGSYNPASVLGPSLGDI